MFIHFYRYSTILWEFIDNGSLYPTLQQTLQTSLPDAAGVLDADANKKRIKQL